MKIKQNQSFSETTYKQQLTKFCGLFWFVPFKKNKAKHNNI